MSQSRRKYIYRSRAEWSRLLAEYEAGDTTQRDFCVERGLSYSNFCRWRRRLRTEAPDDGPVGPLIELPLPPESAAIPKEERVVIGEKVTHRLAQRPGSYVILKYVRPVIRQAVVGNAEGAEDTGNGVKLITAPAPANVLERSVADVSFLSGMLVDKFVYHLPLYRQHQRLAQCGVTLSRTTLSTLAGQAIDLLSPTHTCTLWMCCRGSVNIPRRT